MGKRYPSLDRGQVETILTALKFSIKRQKSSHAHWEGYVKGRRRIVTVDHLKSRKEKYSTTLLRKMIEQTGLSKDKFYSYL
jgi:predicted RNA binding protein YcfA (HicA-like mRNA interferase family)